MPVTVPRLGNSTLTRNGAGLTKGTAPSPKGRSLAPLSRGKTDPSATNATRPREGSRSLKWFASSTVSTCSLARSRSTFSGTSARLTTSGNSSSSTARAARPSTLRPRAGRPTAILASTKSLCTTIEVRMRTFWEGRCISTLPLPPEPRSPRTTAWTARSTSRVRKSSKAVLRTRFSKRERSKRLSLVLILIRDGGAKGSRWTRSMKSVKSPKSKEPARSL